MYRMADNNRPRRSRIDTQYALRMWTLCVLLPCLTLALIGGVAAAADSVTPRAGHVVATEQAAAEVCFRKASWDAYYEDRPCDTLARPLEDGSGHLTLGTLGADAAECIIPNPYEERGEFVIHCHRVPNR